MILRNPHIVDEYFSMRFEECFKVYFGSDCLDTVWNWYRIEYQARGTAHIHNCVHLKPDPGCTLLSEKILDGCLAERELVCRGIDYPCSCVHRYHNIKMSWLLTNS